MTTRFAQHTIKRLTGHFERFETWSLGEPGHVAVRGFNRSGSIREFFEPVEVCEYCDLYGIPNVDWSDLDEIPVVEGGA